jgi:hypothetical protein
MRALVVYESMFGNTQTIAKAIADGLSTRMPVDVWEVSTAPSEIDADGVLLVVGGPTHAFGMTRPQTRQDAAKQGGGHVVSPGIGIREWLGALRLTHPSTATAFDTRVKTRWPVPGSAARGAMKHLKRLGFATAAPAHTFYVTGTPGPLLEGERDRARLWGETLAAQVGLTSGGRTG